MKHLIKKAALALFAAMFLATGAFAQIEASVHGTAMLPKILDMQVSDDPINFWVTNKDQYVDGVHGEYKTTITICATCDWKLFCETDGEEIVGDEKGVVLPIENIEKKVVFLEGQSTIPADDLDIVPQGFQPLSFDKTLLVQPAAGKSNIGDVIKFKVFYRLGKNPNLPDLLTQQIPGDNYQFWIYYTLEECIDNL